MVRTKIMAAAALAVLAGTAFAGNTNAAREEGTGLAAGKVLLSAPYAYGLLGSAACIKRDEALVNELVTELFVLAKAKEKPERADGEAYCKAMTAAFPVSDKWAAQIIAKAEAAGDDAPAPYADGETKGPGQRISEIEIGFLGFKLKLKFEPKQPADSEGHTEAGKPDGEDTGDAQEGGEKPPEGENK